MNTVDTERRDVPSVEGEGRASSRRLSIGVPWVLVLLHAVALIVSSMVGLAMALLD